MLVSCTQADVQAVKLTLRSAQKALKLNIVKGHKDDLNTSASLAMVSSIGKELSAFSAFQTIQEGARMMSWSYN